jgi:hypothetical protein
VSLRVKPDGRETRSTRLSTPKASRIEDANLSANVRLLTTSERLLLPTVPSDVTAPIANPRE